MRKLIAAGLCLMLMGCVASGTQVKESQLAQFKQGKTTYDDVVARLGPPNSSSLLPDGSRVIVYTYVQAAARPETFIPIVGGLVGGADVHSNMVMFQFTSAGILKSYSSNTTQIGSGTNLEAGSPPSRSGPTQAP